MCAIIYLKNGETIGTIKQAQDFFKCDLKKYGFDGDENFIDCCLCDIDLKKLFADQSEKIFKESDGDYIEISNFKKLNFKKLIL